MRYLRRIISGFLVLCMVISIIPPVFATETSSNEGRIMIDQSIAQTTVWIDGVEYAVQSSGGSYFVNLPAGAEPSNMVTYNYHVGDADDVHTQYPIGMDVWALKKNTDGSYTPEKIEELNNILQYSGSSIRITGNKGIRMITSIEQDKKNNLTSGGLAGYKLLEYGTVLAWSSNLTGGNPLVLGPDYAKSNYAYKKGVADPIFAYDGNLIQYTNVLVDFTMDECKDDIAMRPYMILEDEDGEQMTIYGGIVHRSIGYIAWQNRNVFTPGSAAYNYVWEIIRHVYAEVTFQTNGGSAIESAFVQKSGILEKSADPQKEGYTFGGWYIDEALTKIYDFSKPINDDLILYAKWDEFVSRGRWIEMLVSAYGYPYNIDGAIDTFADIDDSEYRTVVETAVVYGILDPAPNINFSPDSVATREFAAVTAVNSMGYSPTIAIVCNDVAEISNPKAVNQAINSGLMDLEDGFFYPNRALKQSEAMRILNKAEDEFNTVNGNNGTDIPDGLVFLENVINKSGPFDWDIIGDKIVLPSGEETPRIGQIITFGTEKAIRIETIEEIGGKVYCTYSNPELYEFLDSMDVEGTAEMDFTKFIPAEGVTVTSSSCGIQTMGFMDELFDVPNTDLTINENASLNAEVKLAQNVKLVANLDVSIPSVAYKFDIDFGNPLIGEDIANVKNAYAKISEDINVHVEVVASDDDVLMDDIIYPDYIELGSIPLVGADGIGIVLEVDLVLSPEGKFEVDYNVHGTLGVQVLNNQPKNISALQSSTSVGLAGAVKIGPKMRLLAEVFEEDLLSFSAEAGIKAGGSVHVRSTGLVCLDAGITAFAEINAFEQSLLDEWLNIALKFTIWNESNSPIKLTGHWENLVKVDNCTYNNNGTIKGTVANADNRTQYIPGAVIKTFDHADISEELTSVVSDSNGQYTTHVSGGGTVLIRISADGYIPFECLQTVGESQLVYLETFLMVEGSEDSGETGTIGGKITNAVTGVGVSNATLTIRKGWNMTTGNVVETVNTSTTGVYSVTLPIGNYTINMECDGYITKHFNVAVTRTGNNAYHENLNPSEDSTIELGDLRVVLTWGSSPYDLDSHMWGPTISGDDMFHTYYSNKIYADNGVTHAFLDLDDITSYGPETTTVYNMTANGIYSFYVHDYSNLDIPSSTVMANSGAKVEVYMGEDMIAQYFVPTSGVGNVWHVFDFDAVNGKIVGVNTFTDNSSPSSVGSPYSIMSLDLDDAPEKDIKDYLKNPSIDESEEEQDKPEADESEEEQGEPVTDDSKEEQDKSVTDDIGTIEEEQDEPVTDKSEEEQEDFISNGFEGEQEESVTEETKKSMDIS